MINKRLLTAILLGAALMALAFALRWASRHDMLSADLARRIVQVVIGLGLAGYANLMPKQLSVFRGSVQAEARSQRAIRVGAWALTLAGLIQAALWTFAPLEVADTGSMIAVAGGMTVTAAYALWCALACRLQRGQA